MKLFFVFAVAASTVLLLVQGAPQIRSEELGKAVEQLKEMIKSEIQAAEAKSTHNTNTQWSSYAKSEQRPRGHQEAQSTYYRPREQNYDEHVSL